MKGNFEHFPPPDLGRTIVAEIRKRERRALRARIAVCAAVFVTSLTLVAEGAIRLVADLGRSGFFSFSSLLFSDFSTTVANLPDFIFSITESFPIFSFVIVLSGILFAIWSLAALIDDAALMRRHGVGMA
jgi:hypothetical protein